MENINLINDFKKLNKTTQDYLLNILYYKHNDKYKILIQYQENNNKYLKKEIKSITKDLKSINSQKNIEFSKNKILINNSSKKFNNSLKKINNSQKKNIDNLLKINLLSNIVKNKNILVINNIDNFNNFKKYDITISNNYDLLNKINILFLNNFNLEENIINKINNSNIELLLICIPQNENYNNLIKTIKKPIEFIDSIFYNNIKIILNSNPLAEITIVMLLIKNNIKSLFLSGFNFTEKRNKNNYLNISDSKSLIINNNLTKQKLLLQNIYKKNILFNLDYKLNGIIFNSLILFINEIRNNYSKLFINIKNRYCIPKFIKKYNNNDIKIFIDLSNSINIDNLSNYDLILTNNIKFISKNKKILFISEKSLELNTIYNVFNIKTKGNIFYQNNNIIKNNKLYINDNYKYIFNHNFVINNLYFKKFLNIIKENFDISYHKIIYILLVLIFDENKKSNIYISKSELNNNKIQEFMFFLYKNNLVNFINI